MARQHETTINRVQSGFTVTVNNVSSVFVTSDTEYVHFDAYVSRHCRKIGSNFREYDRVADGKYDGDIYIYIYYASPKVNVIRVVRDTH